MIFWGEEADRLLQDALTADSFSARLEQALARVRSALGNLAGVVGGLERELPTQRGFFTDQISGGDCFPAFCRAMRSVELCQAELLDALTGFSALERFSEEQRGKALRAEVLLREAGENAFADLLLQDGDRVRELLVRERQIACMLQDFCRDRIVGFCKQAFVLADAERNGERFRAAALQVLCGELVFSLHQMERALDIRHVIADGEANVC